MFLFYLTKVSNVISSDMNRSRYIVRFIESRNSSIDDTGEDETADA